MAGPETTSESVGKRRELGWPASAPPPTPGRAMRHARRSAPACAGGRAGWPAWCSGWCRRQLRPA
eukprot:scaffold19041_cov90-Isochrysis_galbana.AAC.2